MAISLSRTGTHRIGARRRREHHRGGRKVFPQTAMFVACVIFKAPCIIVMALSVTSKARTDNTINAACGALQYKNQDHHVRVLMDEEDGTEPNDSIILEQSLKFMKDTNSVESNEDSVHIPPWLHQHKRPNKDTKKTNFQQPIRSAAVAEAEENLDVLKSLLSSSSSVGTRRKFTSEEAADVIQAVHTAAHGDVEKIAGSADFLCLLLDIDHHHHRQQLYEDDNRIQHESNEYTDGDYMTMMTRDALIASAYHYCDCVSARVNGMYEIVEKSTKITGTSLPEYEPTQRSSNLANKRLSSSDSGSSSLSLSVSENDLNKSNSNGYNYRGKSSRYETTIDNYINSESLFDGVRTESGNSESSSSRIGIEWFGDEAVKIASGAARIKRTEVIADALAGKSVPSRAEYGSYRDLLLSVSEDWRALAIRSTACLYRLQGLLDFFDSGQNESGREGNRTRRTRGKGMKTTHLLTPEIVRVGREALTIYAPLAQMLGMQRLKSELESAAFRVLYHRQYSVANKLYHKGGDSMMSIADYITSRVEELLQNDVLLMKQIETISVTSRVKEPYSLWRKLLKIRMKRKIAKSSLSRSVDSSELSVTDVPDAIALRIVLSAKVAPSEDDETTRARERVLCYYVQKLCSDRWQAVDAQRFKDYIKHPKPNGYQSLHYTARFFRDGEYWPFEVQVRSEEMHRIAEYGVAAHWDYKLQGSDAGDDLSSSPSSSLIREANSPPLLLPQGKRSTSAESVDPSMEKKRAERLAPYIEALATAQSDLAQKTVFIFISPSSNALDGKILPLPAGATVLDALREGEDKYGVQMQDLKDDVSIFLNGMGTNLENRLSNGDVLTLPVIEGNLK